jgi:hypothetical protein
MLNALDERRKRERAPSPPIISTDDIKNNISICLFEMIRTTYTI